MPHKNHINPKTVNIADNRIKFTKYKVFDKIKSK